MFVLADSNNSPAKSKFLDPMAGIPDDESGMLMNSDAIPPGGISDHSDRLRMYGPGLGRSVLLYADERPDAVLDLKEAAAHVWKIRSKMQFQFRDIGTSKQLSMRLLGAEFDQFDDSQVMSSPFQQVRLAEMDFSSSILLPDTVRSIPLSVVIVDSGFVSCRDCALRLLRVWPFQLSPVHMAAGPGRVTGVHRFYSLPWQFFVDGPDYRTSLEFVDLTTGNRVIRSSRFEMLFTATQKDVATELKQTLYTPVNLRSGLQENESNSARGMRTSDIAHVSFDTTNEAQALNRRRATATCRPCSPFGKRCENGALSGVVRLHCKQSDPFHSSESGRCRQRGNNRRNCSRTPSGNDHS